MSDAESTTPKKEKLSKSVNPIGFFRGFGYVFSGARFVYLRHPGLVRFWIVPILISIIAIGGALKGAWAYSEDIVNWIWPEVTGDGFFASIARGIHSLVEVLVSAVVWITSLVVVVALSNVIAAPFNDALSEEVEKIETCAEGVPFSFAAILRDTGRTIYLEVYKLLVYFGIMGPLLCCSFMVPGFGQAAYSVVGFVFTSLYLAIDYIDWPACRRNKKSGYRWEFIKRRFSAALGFGTGVFFLLFIPGVNLFFMPAAVAGGTLLFLDLEGERPSDALKMT